MSCFQCFKDTEMKANHNYYIYSDITYCVVSNASKIQIQTMVSNKFSQNNSNC